MVLPFGSGAHDKGKWLRSGLEHSTAGNSSFFALNLIFQLHGCPAYCLCPAPSILGLQTRDKHCHCVVHQGNGEALTTIGFQSQGKKMLVHQFCLLLYIILYLLPTADNDFLTYPVWLVEVKSSKNTFLFSWCLLWYSCLEKAQDLFPLSLLFWDSVFHSTIHPFQHLLILYRNRTLSFPAAFFLNYRPNWFISADSC